MPWIVDRPGHTRHIRGRFNSLRLGATTIMRIPYWLTWPAYNGINWSAFWQQKKKKKNSNGLVTTERRDDDKRLLLLGHFPSRVFSWRAECKQWRFLIISTYFLYWWYFFIIHSTLRYSIGDWFIKQHNGQPVTAAFVRRNQGGCVSLAQACDYYDMGNNSLRVSWKVA